MTENGPPISFKRSVPVEMDETGVTKHLHENRMLRTHRPVETWTDKSIFMVPLVVDAQ